MSVVSGLSALLLLLPAVDLLAAVILVYVSHRHPDIRTLRERAVAAVLLTLAALLAGAVGAAGLHWISADRNLLVGLLGVSLVLISVPQLYWLVLLVTGRLGPE